MLSETYKKLFLTTKEGQSLSMTPELAHKIREEIQDVLEEKLRAVFPESVEIALTAKIKQSDSQVELVASIDAGVSGEVGYIAGGGVSLSAAEFVVIPPQEAASGLREVSEYITKVLRDKGWNTSPMKFGWYSPQILKHIEKEGERLTTLGERVPMETLMGWIITWDRQ